MTHRIAPVAGPSCRQGQPKDDRPCPDTDTTEACSRVHPATPREVPDDALSIRSIDRLAQSVAGSADNRSNSNNTDSGENTTESSPARQTEEDTKEATGAAQDTAPREPLTLLALPVDIHVVLQKHLTKYDATMLALTCKALKALANWGELRTPLAHPPMEHHIQIALRYTRLLSQGIPDDLASWYTAEEKEQGALQHDPLSARIYYDQLMRPRTFRSIRVSRHQWSVEIDADIQPKIVQSSYDSPTGEVPLMRYLTRGIFTVTIADSTTKQVVDEDMSDAGHSQQKRNCFLMRYLTRGIFTETIADSTTRQAVDEDMSDAGHSQQKCNCFLSTPVLEICGHMAFHRYTRQEGDPGGAYYFVGAPDFRIKTCEAWKEGDRSSVTDDASINGPFRESCRRCLTEVYYDTLREPVLRAAIYKDYGHECVPSENEWWRHCEDKMVTTVRWPRTYHIRHSNMVLFNLRHRCHKPGAIRNLYRNSPAVEIPPEETVTSDEAEGTVDAAASDAVEEVPEEMADKSSGWTIHIEHHSW